MTIPQTITFGALGGKTFGDAAFNVSATGGASGQPVTFSIFSGPATIAGSTVTLTGAGSVTVRASQAGAGEYSAAASVDQMFSVAKASQSISFTNPGARTFGDAAFALVATGGGSGNAVTFSIVSGPASVAGNLLTITGAGSITVRASQAGNANYFAAADADQTFSAAKAAQAITFTNPGARAFGDAAFALVATGGGSGEAVTFSVVSGPASVAGNLLTITGVGSITVRASQAGNADYFAAADVEETFTAAKAAQVITFTNPGARAFGDAAFALVATGGGSGEAVTFSVVSGPASVAGSTLTITGVGSITVRASQAGNANYFAATDVDQTFTAAKAAQSISFTNPGARTFGDAAFALVATGGGSGEAVTFSVVSGPASVAGNMLTITGAGSITVRASQAGNANYFAATDADQTFAAAKASQAIAFTNPGGKTFGDAAFALVATGGGSGEAVTFSVVSGPASVAGNLLTITGAGSITVRASQAGNANYFAAADADQTFSAAKAAQAITFTNPGAHAFGDAAFALVATGGGSGNAVTFSVVSGPASVAGNLLTITGAGSITVRASQAGNADYFAAADVEETFSVAKAAQSISFTNPGARTFGDAAFALVATGGGSGEAVTFSVVSGPASVAGNMLTITGAGSITVRASQAGNANYFAAADADQTFATAKASQAITFTNPGAHAFGDAAFALVATGGGSGEAVTFSVVSGPASVAGSTLTITGVGSITVRASQAGNADYFAAADVDQTITVELNHAPVAVDDAVTTTTGDTTLYPLANDTDADGDSLSIASVSDAGVTISGRALIIPQGTASFTYEVTDGSGTDTGAVTVVAGTPLVAPTAWTGLLYATNGDIAGYVNLTKSASGRCTAALKVGAKSKSVMFMLSNTGEGTATIELGALTATQEAVTKRMTFSLVSGGDTLSGSLRPAKRTATAEQHNIALASVDAAVPGGGYARAFVKADGVIVVAGVLPDGRAFTHKTRLSDNGSYALYTVVSKTQTTGIVGGEFVTANLTSTDVTGELAWAMGAQPSGVHAGGVNTTLTANGSLYTPSATLPAGAVTLTASGGNLAAPLEVATTATDGLPLASVAFPSWKVSVSRAVRTGLFGAKVKDPARARAVTGGGVYLPKSNSAWGYFPGTSEGGRIQLTQP